MNNSNVISSIRDLKAGKELKIYKGLGHGWDMVGTWCKALSRKEESQIIRSFRIIRN